MPFKPRLYYYNFIYLDWDQLRGLVVSVSDY
jgi:hypothetical protein